MPSHDRDKLFKAFGHEKASGFDAIARRIRELRVQGKMSQAELAGKLGITRTMLSSAELGRASAKTVAPIVYNFFGVEASEQHEDNQHQKAENLGDPVPEGQ